MPYVPYVSSKKREDHEKTKKEEKHVSSKIEYAPYKKKFNKETDHQSIESRHEDVTPEKEGWKKRIKEVAIGIPEEGKRLAQRFYMGLGEPIDWVSQALPEGYQTHLAKKAAEKFNHYQYPEEGSIKSYLHRGAELAGGTLGTAVTVAPLLQGAAAAVPTTAVRYGAPLAKKALGKVGEWLGSKYVGAALKGNVKPLAKMVGHAAPIGVGGAYIQHETDLHPVLSDLLAGGGYGVGHYAGKHAYNVFKNAPSVQEAVSNLWGGAGKGVERDFQRSLRRHLGKENLPEYEERIRSYESPLEGYEATVAERTAPRPGHQKPLHGFSELEDLAHAHPQVSEMKSRGSQFLKKSLEETKKEGVSPTAALEALRYEHKTDAERLQDILGKLEPKHHFTREDVGQQIRKDIQDYYNPRRDYRSEVTKPLYEKVSESKTKGFPEKSLKYAHSLVEGHTPPPYIDKYTKKIHGYLGPDILAQQIKHTAEPEYTDAVKSLLKKDKGYAKVLEKIPHEQKVEMGLYQPFNIEGSELKPTMTAGQLEGVRQELTQDLLAAKKEAMQGAPWTKHHHIKEYRNALAEDLENIEPLAAEARAKYSELSEPLQAVEKDKILKKSRQYQDYREEHPTYSDAQLAADYLTGHSSPEYLHRFKEVLGAEGEPTVERITDWGKNELLNRVVNEHGTVDINKIKSFAKQHPSQFEANPSLMDDLAGLEEAQKTLASKFGREKKGSRDILGGAENQSKLVEKTLSGADKSKQVGEVLSRLEALSADVEGAPDSFLNGVLDHMVKKITKDGTVHITPSAFHTYMRNNGDVLKKILEPYQYNVLENTSHILSGRKHAGTFSTGSATAPRQLLEKEFLKKEGRSLAGYFMEFATQKVPLIKAGMSLLSEKLGKSTSEIKRDILAEIVTDAEKALHHIKRARYISDEDILSYLKKHVPEKGLNYLMSSFSSSYHDKDKK
jgi:hypothetical protein